MSEASDIRQAVRDERERIAAWHDRQADALDRAMERIASEGGIVVSPRTLAELHRAFAKAIRDGAE